MRYLYVSRFMCSPTGEWNNMVKRCLWAFHRVSANLTDAFVSLVDEREIHRSHVCVQLQGAITPDGLSSPIRISRPPTGHLRSILFTMFFMVGAVPYFVLLGIPSVVSTMSSVSALTISHIPSKDRSLPLLGIVSPINRGLLPQQLAIGGSPGRSKLCLAFPASRLKSIAARGVFSKFTSGKLLVAKATGFHIRMVTHSMLVGN